MSATIAHILSTPPHDRDWPEVEAFTVQGWIRTSRFSKRVTFLRLYDGSTSETIQIVVSPAVSPELKTRLGVGTSVRISGLWVASKGSEQAGEMLISEDQIEIIGDCDPSEFPIQKKEASREFLRTMPHLRVRTEEFQQVFIARHKLAMATHQFFDDQGFMWVHTPLITASDCEGAGEMFKIAPFGDQHFFGREAYLTVSGQLEVEPFACAFTKVYTFGPTFRAENSQTTRHASEFWMIEPELAFASVHDVMDLAEGYVKHLAQAVGREELVEGDFERITYRKAMEILEESGQGFEFPVGWGHHLQTEHEKYLTEVVFQKPVFVTHYPADQKPFYMRSTRMTKGEMWDGTVECFDLLVPGVGELIGGSAREEDLEKLIKSMSCHGMDPETYDWYLDLRRYGSVPHGGFGLGFERALMWLMGIENIRDSIPYPRTPGVVA